MIRPHLARRLKPQEARTALTMQASTALINHDSDIDSIRMLQAQRLIELAGVSSQFALIIAPLAFGGKNERF